MAVKVVVITLVVIVVLVILLSAILLSGILSVGNGIIGNSGGNLSPIPLPGIGYINKQVIRSCSAYQTYSLSTAVVDSLPSYPLSDDQCQEGTVVGLEKVSETCDPSRSVGCLDPYSSRIVEPGGVVTYYLQCGNLPYCDSLSVNILYQGRCVNLQEGLVKSCAIGDSYLFQGGQFRIPITGNCISQLLVPTNCSSAAIWQYASSDGRISSGNIYLSVLGDRVTITTDARAASSFTLSYAR